MSSFKLIDEETTTDPTGKARFTVFGVGGGGGNAVEHMVRSGITGVTFVCANTDKQALDRMSAQVRVQLGSQTNRGLGAGANPEVGRQAAEEEAEALKDILKDADMVFVTAGMGGGTGTGAAPVIARTARELGVLTVGVVTTPFDFEGRKRIKSAEKGIEDLAEHVDSLIIIPNQKLLTVYSDLSMVEAFKKADNVLLTAVSSIFELIMNHGRINLDFADLKTVMSNRGYAMMGIGTAKGDDRARMAAEAAIRSPLLDNVRMENARGILVNITASEDIKPKEYQTVSEVVAAISDVDEGDIFYGTVIDPDLKDELRVTVIATGLTREENTAVHKPLNPVQITLDSTDAPAINRRVVQEGSEESVVATDAPPVRPAADRPISMSIQDYLKNQQKKS